MVGWKRHVIFFALLFCGFLIQGKGTLIYLRAIDATHLDPGSPSELWSSEVIMNIFEGLVRYRSGSYEVEPCLAESWKTDEGGKRWVFSLRSGVRFHNGMRFDAQSVVDTFMRRLKDGEAEPRKWWFFFPYLNSIRVLDDRTVEIVLEKPYAPLLCSLADPIAAIVAPQSYGENGSFSPIGTGPFRFQSWELGKDLVIKRNEDYWGGRIALDQVIYKVVANPAAKTARVRNGVADIARINSATEYDQLLGIKEVKVLTTNSLMVFYLAFNIRKPPFDRVEVRRAFAHMINKVGMIKHTFQKLAIPAVTPIPPSLFGSNDRIEDYKYDMDEARRLLQHAGLGNGFSSRLYFAERNLGARKIAGIVAGNARQLKIDLTRVPLPFNELTARCDSGEHDIVLLGWSGPPDPDFFLYPTLTMERGNKNRAFYDNPRLTEILLRAKATLDQRRRIELYREAQRIIHRDVAWISLYHAKSMVTYRDNVHGLYVNPSDYMIFRQVTKE